MQAQGVVPDVSFFNALVQFHGTTGQIIAGFGFLEQVRSDTNGDWYPVFRVLLEACRTAGIYGSALEVQTAIERLGLVASRPVATTLVQGSERQYENGRSGGDDAEAAKLCLALRQQIDYMPQLQALPWAFTQNSTRKQQEDSLKLHAEKKALSVLLARGEAQPDTALTVNPRGPVALRRGALDVPLKDQLLRRAAAGRTPRAETRPSLWRFWRAVGQHKWRGQVFFQKALVKWPPRAGVKR